MKKQRLNKTDFFQAIQQVAKQNLLSTSEIEEIIRSAIFKSFHTKFDPDAELELKIDVDKKVFQLINHSKYVVDQEVEDKLRTIEVPLEIAQKINPQAKVDDVISEEVDFSQYSRSMAQLIRQLIIQRVKEKRKETIFEKHKGLEGEMINATITSIANNYVILELDDGVVAFMPNKHRNPNIPLKVGQVIKVYVEKVLRDAKEAQIIVSNGSKAIVKRLLEIEVPEIVNGIVEIVGLARIPGQRTKVAVRSINPNVDAIGTIIGNRGYRINSIIDKLSGEKLDVIAWSSDLNTFIANALSPAKVIAVIDKKNDQEEVIEGQKIAITPNLHQTLAIGKLGSNVRLAAELTASRIDVLSINQAHELGYAFDWNGNVSPEQVEQIEQGLKVNTNRSKNINFNRVQLDTREFDNDIQSFNENIANEKIETKNDQQEISFEIPAQETFDTENEVDISDEDLQKMQEAFEFGDLQDFDLETDDTAEDKDLEE